MFRARRVVAGTAVLVDAEGGVHRAEDLRGTRRRADAGGGVKAIEADAIRGEGVDVRRVDHFIRRPGCDPARRMRVNSWAFIRLEGGGGGIRTE